MNMELGHYIIWAGCAVWGFMFALYPMLALFLVAAFAVTLLVDRWLSGAHLKDKIKDVRDYLDRGDQ